MKKFNNLRIETLEEKLKTSNPPFDPDPPKKNPSAVAGKYGQGYSTAKHLAQRGMAQGPKKIAEEISKSEVEHHHDEWMNSEHRPYQSDAGNDPKIHKQALRYLSTTDVPKEKHEELALHIADKFHGSGIGEAYQTAKSEFVARQGRLTAAAAETEKDPARLKRMSNIPGYSAAMDLAKKTTQGAKHTKEATEYTFAEYLDAARAQYNDEDAVLVANEAFKNQDITLFADQSQSPEA